MKDSPTLTRFIAHAFGFLDRPNAEDGPWKVTLDLPCFEPFMKHSQSRQLRETVYRAYVTRASQGDHDNSDIIEEIRTLRYV